MSVSDSVVMPSSTPLMCTMTTGSSESSMQGFASADVKPLLVHARIRSPAPGNMNHVDLLAAVIRALNVG